MRHRDSGGGRGRAIAVIVAAIVTIALVESYSAASPPQEVVGLAKLAAQDKVLAAQDKVVMQGNQARAAQARVARLAARQAAARAARRKASLIASGHRVLPALGFSGGNVCAPIGPRSGGKAQRQLRRQRQLQRKRALYYLNLSC